MPFKPVLLWTDAALWALLVALGLVRLARACAQPHLRANWLLACTRWRHARRWRRCWRCSCSSALLDSVHFRRALPPAASGKPTARAFYDPRTVSLLDVLLAEPLSMRETTYSAPLGHARADHARNFERNGGTVREFRG